MGYYDRYDGTTAQDDNAWREARQASNQIVVDGAKDIASNIKQGVLNYGQNNKNFQENYGKPTMRLPEDRLAPNSHSQSPTDSPQGRPTVTGSPMITASRPMGDTHLYPSRGVRPLSALEQKRTAFFGPGYVPQKTKEYVPEIDRPRPNQNDDPSSLVQAATQPTAAAPIEQDVIRGTDRTMQNYYEDEGDVRGLDSYSSQELYAEERSPELQATVANLIEDRRVHRSWGYTPGSTKNKRHMKRVESSVHGEPDRFIDMGSTQTNVAERQAGNSVTGGFYDPISGAMYKTKRGAIRGLSEDRVEDRRTLAANNKNKLDEQSLRNRGNVDTANIRAKASRANSADSMNASKYRTNVEAKTRANQNSKSVIAQNNKQAQQLMDDGNIAGLASMLAQADDEQARAMVARMPQAQRAKVREYMKVWQEQEQE